MWFVYTFSAVCEYSLCIAFLGIVHATVLYRLVHMPHTNVPHSFEYINRLLCHLGNFKFNLYADKLWKFTDFHCVFSVTRRLLMRSFLAQLQPLYHTSRESEIEGAMQAQAVAINLSLFCLSLSHSGKWFHIGMCCCCWFYGDEVNISSIVWINFVFFVRLRINFIVCYSYSIHVFQMETKYRWFHGFPWVCVLCHSPVSLISLEFAFLSLSWLADRISSSNICQAIYKRLMVHGDLYSVLPSFSNSKTRNI